MSNTFNISRFNRLLAFDGRNYFKRFGLVLAIIIGVNVVAWVILSFFQNLEITEVLPLSRYILITLFAAISIAMAPGIAFGDINDKRAGASQMMMPVSILEKFLSLFLYCCLLTPVLCVVGSLILDTLLALLSFGKYEGFTWSQFVMQFHPKSLIVNADADEDLWALTFNLDNFYRYWVQMIALPSVCLYANMVFKKSKVAKTFLVAALIWFLVIAVLLMIYRIGIDAFWSPSSREIFRQFYTLSRDEQLNICLEFFGRRNWVWFGCFGFIGLLGYILSYIKLKTLKY
ncbi:MAG: hypothetical protein MJZ91_01495 [Bacteroidales bacterium]|nr:hypothetical protein [Bacteroidales bacterium]